MWAPQPEKRLVVYAAEGSTATRFMLAFLAEGCARPLRTAHYLHPLFHEGARAVQPYDILADIPVTDLFCKLLFAFPRALFVQGIRPVQEWASKRLQHKHLRPYRVEDAPRRESDARAAVEQAGEASTAIQLPVEPRTHAVTHCCNAVAACILLPRVPSG